MRLPLLGRPAYTTLYRHLDHEHRKRRADWPAVIGLDANSFGRRKPLCPRDFVSMVLAVRRPPWSSAILKKSRFVERSTQHSAGRDLEVGLGDLGKEVLPSEDLTLLGELEAAVDGPARQALDGALRRVAAPTDGAKWWAVPLKTDCLWGRTQN